MEVKSSIALVTGGGQGLGLAIARRLADDGAIVVVADHNVETLSNLPAGLKGVTMDVTNPEQVKKVVAEIIACHGRLDILVNNAGVIYSEPFVNVMNPAGIMHGYDRFRASLNVNLDSVFIVTAAVVEQMVTHRTRGAIVNISSVSACGNAGQTAYSAAKAGVNALTITWAQELGRWGIRSNAVAPGFIGTDSTRHALSETMLQHIESNTPLHRLGKAEEVAQAVIALIENDFINGTILNVDGGLRL